MKKKKKTPIALILLLPLLFVVLIQGVLPFTMLVVSGAKDSLVEDSVTNTHYIAENRKRIIQEEMIEEWSTIRKESPYLNTQMESLLGSKGYTIEEFLDDAEIQNEYISEVFPEIFEAVKVDQSNGAFLILLNSEDTTKEANYRGFFIRDTTPTSKTQNNSDLSLVRGNSDLAHSVNISYSAFKTKFEFGGAGVNDYDEFFYTPYLAATQNVNSASALGYWSSPFILENNTTYDSHVMITYSLPLIYNGVVYGIVGSEIAVSHLKNTFLPLYELDNGKDSGYMLAVKTGDNSYQCVVGNGQIASAIAQEKESFTLTTNSIENLYEATPKEDNSQEIYAVMSTLELYENNVPYESSNWVLIGYVYGDSIFAFSNQLYQKLFFTIATGVVLGMIIMILVVVGLLKPIRRLMESLRGGTEGIENYQNSRVSEVEQIHDIVYQFAENEKKAAMLLGEEKERYRVALESSSDVFFTYKAQDNSLEIVNSTEYNGIYYGREILDKLIYTRVRPDDRDRVENLFRLDGRRINEIVSIYDSSLECYRYAEIEGKIIDSDKNGKMCVGYIRDIHDVYQHEIEQDFKRTLDPVTMFYNLNQGMNVIKLNRDKYPTGVFALIEICNFTDITKRFGITFGDVILESFGKMMRDYAFQTDKDNIIVRLGYDEFLIWLPNCYMENCDDLLKKLSLNLASIVRESVLELRIYSGCVMADPAAQTEELIRKCKQIVLEEKGKDPNSIVSSPVDEKLFSEIVSFENPEQIGLTSLALHLFDRSESFIAALDLLSLRLQYHLGLENLVITSLNHDYLANSIEYQWKPVDANMESKLVMHCKESDYLMLDELANKNTILPISSLFNSISKYKDSEINVKGLAVQMIDNGHYSGTIFLSGLEDTILEDEEKNKLIQEITTIIQNRFNQERHDQSAQAKALFLARMSHEIRTPMNGIIGMTEIALKENQTEEKRVECLNKVKNSSVFLLGLLNDILDMSKIESGKMTLVEDDVNLKTLVDNLYSVVESKLQEKKHQYTVDLDIVHTTFKCDELRLNQVLINLLGNAIKYTNTGGTIELRVKEEVLDLNQSNVTFEVIDNGIGVSEHDQKRIFQSFEQVSNSRSHTQGTGLGLAICNRLVNMMGSQIELESEIDKGSTFKFTIKLEISSNDAVVDDTMVDMKVFEGIHVLVVEDNDINLEILDTILKDEGILVDTARDGIMGVEAFLQSEVGYYDLIIMDIMMPRMNGLDATHEIRVSNREDSKTIPIMAMSANAFDDDVKRSIAAGMNAHLSKPIEVNSLFKMMYDLLQK